MIGRAGEKEFLSRIPASRAPSMGVLKTLLLCLLAKSPDSPRRFSQNEVQGVYKPFEFGPVFFCWRVVGCWSKDAQ